MTSDVLLKHVSEIQPSTYNPRQADPERLELVALSLRKLGWLLPIYADASGEILSGHQRHYVATEMLGLDKVPVSYTAAMDLAQRKAINIAFNRGTNDMANNDTPATLTEAMHASGVRELAEALPDADPSSDAYYRCEHPEIVSVDEIMRINKDMPRPNFAAARMLSHRGIYMPIVIDPDGRLINGIARLEYNARKGIPKIEAVRVTAEEAPFARVALNLLTMDFDLHRRYADLLRFNSFRRPRRVRNDLGRGFVFAMIGAKNSPDLDEPRVARAWKRFYGTTICDFGAGHLHETDILRDIGVDVSPFEPYHITQGTDQISKDASISMARAFLQDVANGKKWDSVFCSSVLNSVPFATDRQHIIVILGALAYPDSTTYAVASHVTQAAWKSNQGRGFVNQLNDNTAQFTLDYEDGILLGEFSSKPKVQKYHTLEEFRDLFGLAFDDVDVTVASNNAQAIAKAPRLPDPARLAEALAFEFDLPYPDGSRMGLVDEALDAFGQRLGMDLHNA